MGKRLSILCVTQLSDASRPFLDEMGAVARRLGAQFNMVVDAPHLGAGHPSSKGYLESILDDALTYCEREYVLRLDDDERCSPAMVEWLEDEMYLAHDHWCFPRMHMWPHPEFVLLSPQLFPDHQTRLSTKAKSGGRHHIHAPSPYGGGVCAPVAIEHHKFLIRSRAEREETSRRWHSDGMTAFSLPEDVLGLVKVVSRGTGVVPWIPETVREMQMVDDGA